MSSAFPPGAVLTLGAFLLLFAGTRWRMALLLILPLVSLALVVSLPDGQSAPIRMFDYQLVLVSSDALGRLFAIIFSLMAFAGGLFALRQDNRLELIAALAYAGGAVGVALAGDLISLFLWWEVMAVASSLVVLSVGGDRALRVAMRYFVVHMLGGTLLFAGILAHVAAGGTLAITQMDAGTLGGGLVLAGVLINAAAPPLSGWLADAYPEGSFSGTVFLSAFTTKAAVYVLIRVFPGTEILIPIGLFMVFYGIVFAVLENDIRRILAYSIVNQVGFMVTGVGIGTVLALNGVAALAFIHIIYKGLLMMSAGTVLYMTGKRKCTEVGGLFQSMPVTTICCIVGALASLSVPLTSGFVSKSMITEAAAYGAMGWTWFLLMAASAGTLLHTGMKFPWFVFFHKDSGLRPPDPPWNMRAAMIFFALLCVGIGVFPNTLYSLLPFPVDYVPYTAAHVINMLQLLLFSGLAFFLLLPLLRCTLTITLDLDWSYRRLAPRVIEAIARGLNAGSAGLAQAIRGIGISTGKRLEKHFGPDGIVSRSTETASMVLLVVLALTIFIGISLFT